jgi:predicted nucleic acid-binding protein
VLVVDASLVVEWCIDARDDLAALAPGERCAPALMWSEARSALHESVWRGRLGAGEADRARARLEDADVELETHPGLAEESWRIADELGWAKTYDAEYVALASLLGCRLVTVDARLRRGADRLGFVVGPTEL